MSAATDLHLAASGRRRPTDNEVCVGLQNAAFHSQHALRMASSSTSPTPGPAPLQLIIDEPAPGQFVWTLLEADPDGGHPLILRSAGDPTSTREEALALGEQVMETETRNRAAKSQPPR